MALSESALFTYLRDELGLDEVEADSPLFSTGALDSVAMLELIAFIEEQAGFQVRPDQVTLENFDTPAAIHRFAGQEAA